MLQMRDWDFSSYLLVVRGDREFESRGLPPSFEDARRLLSRFSDDDFVRQMLRGVMADDFGVYDLYRYNDEQVLDMLAWEIAGGRAQIHKRQVERPVFSEDVPPTPPEKPNDLQAREETTWIEVLLVDEQDNPVPGARYEITRGAGPRVAHGTLDSQGETRVTGIAAGEYKVGFPDLEQDCWFRLS